MTMKDKIEAVHVHCMDAKQVIKEYREQGYLLKERTEPTILAQLGFIKLIFERVEVAETTKGAYLG